MSQTTLCVVVPAYNEERVIRSSLLSLTKTIKSEDIYVVSDGSTDKTAQLARSVVPNVLQLRKNVGKARALYKLIKKFGLTKRYRYIFFFDADTQVNDSFVEEVSKAAIDEPACIVGTVASDRNMLISAYRTYEYGFSHRFFKNAQNVMGTIIIAPGCTSVYRSDVIEKLDFHGSTLTEDFDLTLQIHEKRLGKVVYCPKARVITQDPPTFVDFWKQIQRWNTGFWQNYFLHKLYRPTSKVNLEVYVLLTDFLIWVVTLGLAMRYPIYFLTLFGSSMVVMMAIAVVVIMLERQFWALPYVPLFGFFQLTNFISTIVSFFRAISFKPEKLGWQKVTRYQT